MPFANRNLECALAMLCSLAYQYGSLRYFHVVEAVHLIMKRALLDLEGYDTKLPREVLTVPYFDIYSHCKSVDGLQIFTDT